LGTPVRRARREAAYAAMRRVDTFTVRAVADAVGTVWPGPIRVLVARMREEGMVDVVPGRPGVFRLTPSGVARIDRGMAG
jgi:hypothetical protein